MSLNASATVLRLIGGLAVLTGGGVLVGDGLRQTVSHLGVSDTLLGNTAVAASVEAEELGRVAVPTKRGKPELALGNIAGTIVHFIAFNAGVIALVKPLALNSATLHLHLPVSVAATALFCTLLALRNQLSRLDGLILVGAYVAYVAAAIAVARPREIANPKGSVARRRTQQPFRAAPFAIRDLGTQPVRSLQ